MEKLFTPLIRKSISLLPTLLITIAIFFYSCKKTDFAISNINPKQAEITSKFFDTPTGTDPAVQRIIWEINKRNNKTEFVSNFALKNGYPRWDKVFAVKKGNKNSQNIAAPGASDTIVFIPIVLQDAGRVNGFIRARINDTILLDYSLSQDYKAYPDSSNNTTVAADEFALLIMKLDNLVFEHSQFLIHDSTLFNDNVNNTNITKTVKLQNAAAPSGLNGNSSNNLTVAYYCQDVIITICPTPTVTPIQKQDNTSNNAGVGNGCWTGVFEICWEEIAGGGGTGGGSGTGTSGGGGTGIPHNYPCTPVLVANINEGTLPACPAPGPGTGWVPAPFDKLCSNSLTFREGLNHSFFETNMINLRFTNGSTMNEFSAYYFIPNRMKESTMNTDIPHSPYGITNFPARTALQSIAQDFPDLTISYNSNGGGDIVRIFDATIPPNGEYVYEFSKYAAQRIASTCSNAASSNVILQYGGSCTIPLHFPSQQAYRTQTTSFLKMYFPATGTICRTDPSATSNTSISIYSPTCN